MHFLSFQDWNYRPSKDFQTDEAVQLGCDNTSFPLCFIILSTLFAIAERIRQTLQKW